MRAAEPHEGGRGYPGGLMGVNPGGCEGVGREGWEIPRDVKIPVEGPNRPVEVGRGQTEAWV